MFFSSPLLSFSFGGGLVCAVLLPLPSYAQQALPDYTAEKDVEQLARVAFHGPDLKGKDGPLANAGLDLARLYYDHQRIAREGGDLQVDVGAPVTEGRVTVDAIAVRDSTPALRDALAQLGAERLAASGRLVSGQLPIDQIPAAAQLSSLQSLRPAAAHTQNRTPRSAGTPTSEPSQQESTRVSAPDTLQQREHRRSSSFAIGTLLLLLGILLVLEFS